MNLTLKQIATMAGGTLSESSDIDLLIKKNGGFIPFSYNNYNIHTCSNYKQ